MQLADELPMIWYVCAVACSCLKRLKELEAYWVAYGWASVLSMVIMATCFFFFFLGGGEESEIRIIIRVVLLNHFLTCSCGWWFCKSGR